MTNVSEIYKILGVSETAKPQEIKNAYDKKLTELNNSNDPDKTSKIIQLNEAYENLVQPSATHSKTNKVFYMAMGVLMAILLLYLFWKMVTSVPHP